MNLDYAINNLLGEKWTCEKSISIYEDEKTVYFDTEISREERIKMYKKNIKTLNEAIKILSKYGDKEKEKP